MMEHQWIRTIATDGRWCEACGLAEARWVGEPCSGEGAAIVIERRLLERFLPDEEIPFVIERDRP